MANIDRIEVQVTTGTRPGAGGSGGAFFLGVGGREFRLDRPEIRDFTADNQDDVFILGDGANVVRSVDNDPRTPFRLLTERLNDYPKYIRFEPVGDDDWMLKAITVTVIPGPGEIVFAALGGDQHIWLGNVNSRVLYFGAPSNDRRPILQQ